LGDRANTTKSAAARPRHVHILGAGIAGASAARAFAARGCSVTVIAPSGIADGASGIPAAAVRPRLWRPSAQAAPDAEILADAFRWTSCWLGANAPTRYRRCGVLICAVDPEDAIKVRAQAENPATADVAQWCAADAASKRAGIQLPFGAAWIPSGGCVDLRGLVHDLLSGENIEVRREPLDQRPDLTIDARARVANGEVVRGQAIGVKLSTSTPQTVLCTNGYLCPPGPDGLAWLGSTYDRHDDQTDERPEDDARILSRFDGLPALANALRRAPTTRRFVGVRASTPQRLARVGFAAADHAVSVGHGSRGAVTGPWAGELLAAAAFGETLPIASRHWSRLQSRARPRGE